MSKALPIRRLAAEIEGQPADAVIGKIVGEQNRDLCAIWVQFSVPEELRMGRTASMHSRRIVSQPSTE